MIICSDKDRFLKLLHYSIHVVQSQHSNPGESAVDRAGFAEGEGQQSTVNDAAAIPAVTQTLLTRTMYVLARSQTIRLAFCGTTQALRAYLSSLPHQTLAAPESAVSGAVNQLPTSTSDGRLQILPTLALVNPVSLHRGTAFFSAQGISETLAGAVEAAVRSRMRLVVVETIDQPPQPGDASSSEDAEMTETSANNPGDDAPTTRSGEIRQHHGQLDSWDVRLPILNSATKMYGVSAQGRVVPGNVKARDVVNRWCRMEELPRGQTPLKCKAG